LFFTGNEKFYAVGMSMKEEKNGKEGI